MIALHLLRYLALDDIMNAFPPSLVKLGSAERFWGQSFLFGLYLRCVDNSHL